MRSGASLEFGGADIGVGPWVWKVGLGELSWLNSCSGCAGPSWAGRLNEVYMGSVSCEWKEQDCSD